MFTVRYFGASRNENLFEVTSVFAAASQQTSDKKIESVTLHLSDNSSIELYDGYMYVMNENGKTVANYTLNNEFVEGGVPA